MDTHVAISTGAAVMEGGCMTGAMKVELLRRRDCDFSLFGQGYTV